MAWTCAQCSTEVTADDLTCPQCEAPKSAWTMFTEKTRTFTLSGARLEIRRGDGYQAAPAGDRTYDPARLVAADRLYPLAKQEVRDAHAQGLQPPSVYLVTVRLVPRKPGDLEVDLSIDFEAADVGEHALPVTREPTAAGEYDLRLLFVYGPGDLEGITFPDVDQVIDISEETEAGFAPSVHVAALRKRPKKLPATLLPPWFELHLHSTSGAPLAGWRYQVALGDDLHQGALDEEGRLHLDDVPPGPARVTVLPPEEGAAPEPAEETPLEEQVWLAPDLEPDRDDDEPAFAAEPGPFTFSV